MDDLISREAALDAIIGCFNVMETKGIDMTVARTIVKGILEHIPADIAEKRGIELKEE